MVNATTFPMPGIHTRRWTSGVGIRRGCSTCVSSFTCRCSSARLRVHHCRSHLCRWWQRRDLLHIVLRQQAFDRVLASRLLVYEVQARAQEISRFAMLRADHVRGRDEITPEQLRERGGIDGIGFHLRVADRLDILGMREGQRDIRGGKEVAEPVPI